MDKVKIKRVPRKKKAATVKEKLLAGLGVGATVLGAGMAGGAKPQNPKPIVSNQKQASGKSSGANLKGLFTKYLGVQTAKADDGEEDGKDGSGKDGGSMGSYDGGGGGGYVDDTNSETAASDSDIATASAAAAQASTDAAAAQQTAADITAANEQANAAALAAGAQPTADQIAAQQAAANVAAANAQSDADVAAANAAASQTTSPVDPATGIMPGGLRSGPAQDVPVTPEPADNSTDVAAGENFGETPSEQSVANSAASQSASQQVNSPVDPATGIMPGGLGSTPADESTSDVVTSTTDGQTVHLDYAVNGITYTWDSSNSQYVPAGNLVTDKAAPVEYATSATPGELNTSTLAQGGPPGASADGVSIQWQSTQNNYTTDPIIGTGSDGAVYSYNPITGSVTMVASQAQASNQGSGADALTTGMAEGSVTMPYSENNSPTSSQTTETFGTTGYHQTAPDVYISNGTGEAYKLVGGQFELIKSEADASSDNSSTDQIPQEDIQAFVNGPTATKSTSTQATPYEDSVTNADGSPNAKFSDAYSSSSAAENQNSVSSLAKLQAAVQTAQSNLTVSSSQTGDKLTFAPVDLGNGKSIVTTNGTDYIDQKSGQQYHYDSNNNQLQIFNPAINQWLPFGQQADSSSALSKATSSAKTGLGKLTSALTTMQGKAASMVGFPSGSQPVAASTGETSQAVTLEDDTVINSVPYSKGVYTDEDGKIWVQNGKDYVSVGLNINDINSSSIEGSEGNTIQGPLGHTLEQIGDNGYKDTITGNIYKQNSDGSLSATGLQIDQSGNYVSNSIFGSTESDATKSLTSIATSAGKGAAVGVLGGVFGAGIGGAIGAVKSATQSTASTVIQLANTNTLVPQEIYIGTDTSGNPAYLSNWDVQAALIQAGTAKGAANTAVNNLINQAKSGGN